MKTRILIAEDDPAMGQMFVESLTNAGYDPILAQDGLDAISLFKKHEIDLSVLDIMMPKMDGFHVAQEIKLIDPYAAFLFVTARYSQADKERGFKVGCDDYIVKPFSFLELTLRINAILERTKGPAARNTEILEFKSFRLKIRERTLEAGGKVIPLTAKEIQILHMLASNMNSTVARAEILQKVWGGEDIYHSRSLDVYLTRLRKYLKDVPNVELQNVYGHGFSLVANL